MALFPFGSKKTPAVAAAAAGGRYGLGGGGAPPTLPGYAPPVPFEVASFDERAAAFAEADGYAGGNFAEPPTHAKPTAPNQS